MHYVETVVPGKMHIQCPLNGDAEGGEHDTVDIIFSDATGKYMVQKYAK